MMRSRSSIKIPKHWRSLAYWQSGEWQVIEERLHEAQYCPGPGFLFASLGAVLPESCRVAVFGQDPYPHLGHCTGVAFSVPRGLEKLPPSLVNIFREYEDDLGLPSPPSGDLTPWCEQGVLLWNVYPSCQIGKPGSHHWDEWAYLTEEIINVLDGQVVFVFLGRVASSFGKYVSKSPMLHTSHPSPLGANRGFLGSKIFSRINLSLSGLGQKPIDWCLGESDGQP